ncbi:urea transporter [Streptomyces sp. NPDC090053]|uniref:urea transporter n=1 Tax=Streptomyces sp. NPDC090053 TaxID=3365932 RepID=UPI0038001702
MPTTEIHGRHPSDELPQALAETGLRGFAQVVLQTNLLTGALILAGLFAYSWQAGVFGLFGTVVATVTAYLLGADRTAIHQGLHGFNGCLTGVAVLVFLGMHLSTWLLALFGAAAATLVSAALATVFSTWGLTGLTAPFCVVSGVMVVGAPSFARLWHTGSPAALPTVTTGDRALSWNDLWHAFFNNVAEIFLLNTWYSGLLILAGLFLAGVRVGLFAVAGSVLGIVVAWAFGAPAAVIANGIYGYNAVLVAIALGVTFLARGTWETGYALFGAVLSCALTASLTSFFKPFGGHTFTWPFILTTWLLLLAVPGLTRLRRA